MTAPGGSGWDRLKELFAAAMELPADQREAFAKAHCEDPETRRELLELIAHEPHDEPFLDSPLCQRARPRAIGDYVLGRVLGSGGMGTVYEAHQESPHRTVALKLLQPLAISESVARRFAAEAEILARLQHPAIAQVFAAGTYDQDGSAWPWFAMELVPDAVPLTSWARREELSIAQRLELFVEVCCAVQHGHDKGVVHRDLKPGNVLVGSNGQPKIIDFGVARVTDADVERATMRTTAGELIGTLAYMSPEQCRADPDQIDARSDVYALGVMFYELVTDTLPYETNGLQLPAALRMITDGTPRRAPDIASDLEAIAFKAMEKDPRRRYETAAAFGADVQRYLASEPVTARPPSFTYHLRLMARRHRALFIAGATILVVLTAATTVSSLFAVEAANRADEATGERDAALRTLAIVEGAVRAANPFIEQREVTVGELLDGIAVRLDRGEIERADVRMRLHRQLGATYRGLGRGDDAHEHLTAALALLPELTGDRRLDRADLLDLIGAAHGDRAELDQAIACMVEVEAILTAVHGAGAAELVAPVARQGAFLLAQRKHDEAQVKLERAVELADATNHVSSTLAEACAGLGTVHWQLGRHEKAARCWERALDVFDGQLSARHPLVLKTRNNYGLYLQGQKRFEEAAATFRDARDQLALMRGPRSPDVADAELKLGFLYVETGDRTAAEAAFNNCVDIRRECFGNDPLRVPGALQGLAYLFLQTGRWQEAVTALDEALRLGTAKLPDSNTSIASTRVLLGRALIGAGRASDAEAHLRKALATRLAAFGEGSLRCDTVESALGHCLLRTDRADIAEPLLRNSLTKIEQGLGPNHPEAHAARERLAEWCEKAGKAEEAKALRATRPSVR